MRNKDVAFIGKTDFLEKEDFKNKRLIYVHHFRKKFKRENFSKYCRRKQGIFMSYLRGKVILRGGPYVARHFAHLPNSLCSAEDLENSMSEWHCEWQNRFPEENQEICFAMDISDFDYYKQAELFNMEHKFNSQYNEALWHNETIENTKTKTIEHRADIVFNHYVIEFQHSPMSRKEFNERTWFYTRFGYRMVWVFDVRDEVSSYNMRKNGISGSDGYKKFKWKWDRPFTTFADLDIASEGWHKDENGKWSRGNVVLLFQTKDFNKNALFPPFLEKK